MDDVEQTTEESEIKIMDRAEEFMMTLCAELAYDYLNYEVVDDIDDLDETIDPEDIEGWEFQDYTYFFKDEKGNYYYFGECGKPYDTEVITNAVEAVDLSEVIVCCDQLKEELIDLVDEYDIRALKYIAEQLRFCLVPENYAKVVVDVYKETLYYKDQKENVQFHTLEWYECRDLENGFGELAITLYKECLEDQVFMDIVENVFIRDGFELSELDDILKEREQEEIEM